MEDVPGYPCTISVGIPQFEEAIQIWQAMTQDVPETIKRAAATRDSEDVETVADIIRRMKTIDHSTLLKRSGNRGLNADKVRRVIAELVDRGDINQPTYEPVGGGKTRKTYKWIGGA
jgi:predicted ArsR family transcriptional regulator